MRCLIVDDNPRFLRAARSLLEHQGITVVGVASNSAEALQRAEELQPDVKPAHDADIQPPHRNQIEPVRRGEA